MSLEANRRLSIVVTWRDREELRQALPQLANCASQYAGEITIVNFGGDFCGVAEMLTQLPCPFKVVSVANQRFFNKSRAQNIGAIHAQHDLLFFCDCDILLEEHELDLLVSEVAPDMNSFGTIQGVTESNRNARRAGNVVMFGYQLNLRLANGRSLTIVDNEEDVEDGSRQAPGLLLVHRQNFETVRGYNGKLHGWGWEDQDMISRLTLAGGLRRIQRGYAQHISHDDDARMRHYPLAKDRWENRDKMFRQAIENYDRGDFVGTLDTDAEELVPLCTTVQSVAIGSNAYRLS